jgi:cysteinyl-tRNA synthetase
MILDRPWHVTWDYRPELLERAAARLDSLFRAAGRTGGSDPGAAGELRRLLATDLNVPAALDLAIEAGGTPARSLATTLGLS